MRGRLHGDLELRLGYRFLRRGSHPEGPRPVDRGPERARRRGHRRLGPDALLPRSHAARPRARPSLEVCALLTKPARRRTDVPLPLRRLRDPAALRRSATASTSRSAIATSPTSASFETSLQPRPRRRSSGRGAPCPVSAAHPPATLPASPKRDFLSRFFRSALFPLIVIVLLVYLASQTLLPRSEDAQKVTYSELYTRVLEQPETISGIALQAQEPGDPGGADERHAGQGQLRLRSGADPVPGRARSRRTSSSTPRASAPRAGGRSSPTCFRSSSSSASGSS